MKTYSCLARNHLSFLPIRFFSDNKKFRRFEIQKMTLLDLDQALNLNNRILNHVDWIDEPRLIFLIQHAYSALSVKDNHDLVAFFIALRPGLVYECHAYQWYNKNVPHSHYIFGDRMVVHEAY